MSGSRARARQAGGDWCILRTNGRATLSLATSLTADGIEAWSPSHVIDQRMPRTKGTRERRMPILPTFVFAKATDIDRILAFARMPRHHHPFTVFRHLGHIPLLREADIAPLRASERKAIPKHKHRAWEQGQRVRVSEGSFGGLSGRVDADSRGGFTLVCFNGQFRVKIASFLLNEDDS
jgi:transcription antitermination factor NusG